MAGTLWKGHRMNKCILREMSRLLYEAGKEIVPIMIITGIFILIVLGLCAVDYLIIQFFGQEFRDLLILSLLCTAFVVVCIFGIRDWYRKAKRACEDEDA